MLWEYDLKYSWLRLELKKQGIDVDKSSMYEIMSGRRCGEKAELVINSSLEILKKYETLFANR